MPRYGYDYSLMPDRPNGWRSAFGNILTVGTIVAISAISGSVVALNMLGSANRAPDRPSVVAKQPVPGVRAARAESPTAPQMPQLMIASTNAVATAAPPLAKPLADAAQPAAPGPQAAPAASPASAAAVDEPPTASVPENELTFSRGYARRRAVQAAAHATSGAGAGVAVARVETQTQLGRAAIKVVKPRTFARQYVQDQRRVADAGGLFSRFDSQQDNRYDFGRHQALAFGDPRANASRRQTAPQGGGFGGFFRMF